MRALLIIGGWADGRFVDWLLHGHGRVEWAAAVATVVAGVVFWRVAVRNAREHAAVAAQMAELAFGSAHKPAADEDDDREGE